MIWIGIKEKNNIRTLFYHLWFENRWSIDPTTLKNAYFCHSLGLKVSIMSVIKKGVKNFRKWRRTDVIRLVECVYWNDTPGIPWREEGILEAFLFDSHSSICRIKRTKIYVILDWTTSIFDNRKKRSIGWQIKWLWTQCGERRNKKSN